MQAQASDTDRAQFHSALPPLVLDLDGTLLQTDTLVESALHLLKRRPLALFQMLWLALQGPAALKQWLAERVDLQVARLPWRADLLQWARAQRDAGRRVVLATAAHRRIADAVANHLRLFDGVLATQDTDNLKGARKLAAIQALVGPAFVYAGDSAADLAVWRGSTAAVLVGATPRLAKEVAALVPVEAAFSAPAGQAQPLRLWTKALRVHQWLKNLLVFVPMCAAAAFQADRLVAAVLTFLAFSLAASGTYLMNDLWDLDSDRQHPRKCARPFASGRLSLLHGVAMAGAMLLAGLGLAAAVSGPAVLMLAGYVVLTTAYSWVLKTYVLIDVLTLALLYSYRVLAGAVTTDIVVSPWLLAFSSFTFFSLALVKRCAELMSQAQRGAVFTKGRDYRLDDLVVLWPFGAGASLSAVVVFGLYVAAPENAARFAQPQLLWPVGMGLCYWFGRLWIKTARGEMHDDPIVFALRDRGSRVVLALMGLLVMASSMWPW